MSCWFSKVWSKEFWFSDIDISISSPNSYSYSRIYLIAFERRITESYRFFCFPWDIWVGRGTKVSVKSKPDYPTREGLQNNRRMSLSKNLNSSISFSKTSIEKSLLEDLASKKIRKNLSALVATWGDRWRMQSINLFTECFCLKIFLKTKESSKLISLK